MGEPTEKQLRHYSTPADAVDVLLPHLLAWRTGCEDTIDVLEPCAGKGELAKRLIAAGVRKNAIDMVEPVDYREGLFGDDALCFTKPIVSTIQEYASRAFRAQYDLIITNPPFDIACEVAECCLPMLRAGGQLALLNRLSFLASWDRASFWTRVGQPHTYVLTWRPHFGVCTTGDRWDYAWFVWTKGIAHPGIEWLHRPARDAMRRADRNDGQLVLGGDE